MIASEYLVACECSTGGNRSIFPNVVAVDGAASAEGLDMKAGWIAAELGKVCAFENGDRGINYPSRSVRTSEGIPFINAGHLAVDGLDFSTMDYIPRERFDLLGGGKIKPGDILFCLRGSLGKYASVGDLNEGAIASSLVILRPGQELISRFLLYFLDSGLCKSMIEQYGNGAAQPNLSSGSLKKFLIPLPPLPEQQRIVAILDEAFDGIATAKVNAEKNLQNARELIDIGFQAITESVGRSQWPIRQVETLKASHKGAMRTGPFGSQLLHSEFVDEGIAVLGIDNAVANEFRWDRRRYITKEKYQQMARYRVFPGDVLITIMGTCGRCAVVPDDIPLAINTKHLCCITLDREKCLPEYLHIYFLHDLTSRDYLTAQAKGSIMAGLNMGIISELPVRLPSTEIQAEIVERFECLRSECERLESAQRQKLTALDELKKSLLHRAFNGDL